MIKGLVVKLGSKADESIEENDDAEDRKGRIGEIWLKWRLKGECIAIDALRNKGSMEFDVCHIDGRPSEKSADGCQILQPHKNGN